MESQATRPRTFAHYELLEEIGHGGMGVVYRARDSKLGRTVAIKVLPLAVAADPDRRARFLREARAAARLNHPAIATVYEAGEVRVEDPSVLGEGELSGAGPQEVVYIAMEHVEGEDLGKLFEKGLTLKQALDYGIQISDGLAAAHEAGVIHRDLKPGNVRVTPAGKVKILDFGLAKVVQEVGREELLEPSLTIHGGIVGTVPYMAPEQLQGSRADARADLFSLGVVLYQMLTGRPPFAGGKLVDYVKALAGKRPEPPSKSNPEVSPALERVVERLLAREPEDRYPSAVAVGDELKAIARGRSELGERRADSLFGEVFGPSGRQRMGWGLLVVLVIALLAVLLFRTERVAGPSPRSLAVLPFENRTDDPSLDAYYEGIGVALTRKLSKVPGLDVESDLEVRRFRGTDQTPAQLARALGVGTLLVGDVQGNSKLIRVAVELLDAVTGVKLWATEVEGAPEDLLDLQEKLADQVLGNLPVGVSVPERGRLRRNSTAVMEAYEAYMQGRQMVEDVTDPQMANRAMEWLERSLRADDGFSWAHGELSRALLRSYDLSRDPAVLVRAAEEADRAVSLEPDLPELLLQRAKVRRTQGRYEDAQADVAAILEHNPELSLAYRELGLIYEDQNRLDLAEQSYRQALELRPSSWRNWNQLGGFLQQRSRFEEARPVLERAVELAPEGAVWPLENLATLEYLEGSYEAALNHYRQILPYRQTASVLTNMGAAAFALGRREEAEEHYRGAVEKQPAEPVHWLNLGDTQLLLGRQAEARDSYRKGLERLEEQLEHNPRHGRLRTLQPLFLAKVGDCPRATPLTVEQRREFAGNIPALRRLAKALAVCGEQALAQEVLEELIAAGDTEKSLRGEFELEPLFSSGPQA